MLNWFSHTKHQRTCCTSTMLIICVREQNINIFRIQFNLECDLMDTLRIQMITSHLNKQLQHSLIVGDSSPMQGTRIFWETSRSHKRFVKSGQDPTRFSCVHLPLISCWLYYKLWLRSCADRMVELRIRNIQLVSCDPELLYQGNSGFQIKLSLYHL